MKDVSILTLIQLNQKFYLDNATSFHKTRQHPWNGWAQLVELLPADILMAVDVGCGNGRWFDFLEKENGPKKAIGLDIDSYMLQQSRLKFGNNEGYSFFQADCIQDISQVLNKLVTDKATVVTSFGLWHHIPSYELRLYNLHQLANHVAENGFLCVSLWQFASDPTYNHRLIKPEAVAAKVGVAVEEFEEGDYFLGWQDQAEALRYCHSFNDEEIERLAKDLGLPYKILIGSGNDRTNRYLVAGLGL